MISDVVIIGAGASGMMAAITAASEGKRVTVIEHGDRTGRKILMTGNGRCNYSNMFQGAECYRSSNPEFVKNIIDSFTWSDAKAFFMEGGIMSKERNGYLYPRSGQACVINDFLNMKCKTLGVKIVCGENCEDIRPEKGCFVIKCKTNDNKQTTYKAVSVIVSTGGKSYKKTGSDGSGYELLKKLGHNIIKPLPALTSLHCGEKFFKSLKGVRCAGCIYLYIDDRLVSSDIGELQLTDYGLSGIPVFQVSRYASIALDNKKKVSAVIDFVPECTEEEIIRIIKQDNNLSILQKMNGFVNKKISHVILSRLNVRDADSAVHVENNIIKQAVRMLKSTKVTVNSTGDFEQAQVCCGGADITQIDCHTMQSKIVRNLYITGEVIDVDGICGGYNLQWAWSTGYIAGKHCADM